MERPLRALGATVSGSGPLARRVVPPSHRFDLQSEVDLIEEIARLTGYDAIAGDRTGDRGGGPGCGSDRDDVEQRLRERLSGAGFDEMVTLAMVGADDNRDFPGLPELTGRPVALANPLSRRQRGAATKPAAWARCGRSDENRRQGAGHVAGFTLGRVFAREDDRYHEVATLGLLLVGSLAAADGRGDARAPATSPI